jgi:hypothetical protein
VLGLGGRIGSRWDRMGAAPLRERASCSGIMPLSLEHEGRTRFVRPLAMHHWGKR